MGDAEETRGLLAEVGQATGYLNLQPHQLEAATGLYAFTGQRHRMQRMFVDELRPRAAGKVEPLGPANEGAIQALYAMGDGGGIGFAPFQLATGMFRGIRGEGGDLVAVAGVHVMSSNQSVAGVGNVFTHPNHRGKGYAQAATSAVVTTLREAGIATIGLNVEHDNAAAIAAYERIGFQTRFHYFEGVAARV